MGGPEVAGMAGNGLQIGGIVLGVVFGFIFSAFKRATFTFFGVIAAVGMLIMAFADNIILWTFGLFLQGFAHVGFVTTAQTAAGYTAPRSRIPFVNSMCMGALNLGTFFTPFWMTIGAGIIMPMNIPGIIEPAAALVATAVIYLAFAIFAAFFPFGAIKASLVEKVKEEPEALNEA
jgi:MFS family permease